MDGGNPFLTPLFPKKWHLKVNVIKDTRKYTMKFLLIQILKWCIEFFLYIRSMVYTLISDRIFYSNGVYKAVLYNSKGCQTFHFTNYKHFLAFKMEETIPLKNKIVHCAFLTETDYVLDITDHIKSFCYYFSEKSPVIYWKPILESVPGHTKTSNLLVYMTFLNGNTRIEPYENLLNQKLSCAF